MDKIINVIMTAEKNIELYIDEKFKITIDNDSRILKADEIFELLDYSSGDSYSILAQNKGDKDNDVLNELKVLLQGIIEGIKLIPTIDEQISHTKKEDFDSETQLLLKEYE